MLKKIKYIIVMLLLYVNINANELPLKNSLDEYIGWAENSKKTKPKNNKFSGWDVKPLLDTLISAYEITKDKYYLEKTAEFIIYFLNNSAIRLNEKDFEGLVENKWYRLDRYNIFTVSPYEKYNLKDKKKIMRNRNWVNLNFSDVNYNGLFLEPMLRFAEVVKKEKISEFYAVSNEVIKFSKKNFAQHEKDWVFVSEEGYYTFPKNSPFYLDGIEMPINEVAIYGKFIMRLYNITHDSKYLNRAEKMIQRWKPYFTNLKTVDFDYPYTVGHWYNGEQNISINTPHLPKETGSEVLHKAALTLDFIHEYNKVSEDLKYIVDSFKIKALETYKYDENIVSFFPRKLDNIFPEDTYHSRSVFAFGGIGFSEIISSKNNIYKMGYLNAYVNVLNGKLVSLSTIYRMLIKMKKFSIKSKLLNISPYVNNNQSLKNCMINQKNDSIGIIKYNHMFPKNNRLFLYDVADGPNRRVRLDIKEGAYFNGIIYIPSDKCINLKWFNKNKHSLPKHKDEENIEITLFTIEGLNN